ncbi:MAG: hypothetical protein KAJ39_02760 [Gammaproteobacteria bacterium]|nr:hypothetical protein [Gammaproteobacteria bacterium]
MTVKLNIIAILIMFLSGCGSSTNKIQKSDDDINKSKAVDRSASVKIFPREMRLQNSILIVYQPQLQEWTAHKTLIGWAAVLIKPDNKDKTITGAIKFSAATDVDYEARTVVAYNKKLLEVNFPTLNQQQVNELKINVRNAISKVPEMIPLDMLLASMKDENIQSTPVAISVKPPKIFYRNHVALLLMFNGKPLFAQIKNTSLKFAINTNWDIFQDSHSNNYYLRHNKQWLVASTLKGTWVFTTKLPADFSNLPSEKNWKKVIEAVPAQPVGNEMSRDVIVSFKPAELIVTEGKPKRVSIAGSQLSYIKNTASDLFYHKSNKQYYFLVSGRWFKSKKLNGPWQFAKKLPKAFASIPKDHKKADVRASVPGTEEAKLAILQAQIPQKATVNRSNTTVNVTYIGTPEFKPINGTTLSYAVNTRFDVIRAGTSYYLCYQGVWFVSNEPEGPWKVASAIPKEIYKIPPDSPKYNVVYVKIYDSNATTVTVGYTAGYHNMYYSYGVVMYGTGYYYNPYWYSYPYYPYYPVYYPYYPSYGVAAYYNPYTGTYGRGAYTYGPYGGYGRGASYNPETGRYSRGEAAWGATNGIYARQAYTPSTDVYSSTIQSTNSYAHWGDSVVSRGDDWIKTSHYTDEKGARRQFETSQGAKGAQFKSEDHSLAVAKNKEGELFVGKDKNVYKRSDEGWMKQDGNNWLPIDKSFDPDAAKNKLKEKDITRDTVTENLSNRRSDSMNSTHQDYLNRSNIEQLNRDSQSRSYGNQRYNDYRAKQQSGNLYKRSVPMSGGRFRR